MCSPYRAGDARQRHATAPERHGRSAIRHNLRRYGDSARLLRVLLSASPEGWTQWGTGGHGVAAIIAGSVLGALAGPGAFAPELRQWVESNVQAWMPLAEVVDRRLARERQTCTAVAAYRERKSASTPSRDLLYDKIYGNMLAGAIGNAMGSPVEGRWHTEIDAEYPAGIRTVLQPWRLEAEDDNQLAMLLVETYQRGLDALAAADMAATVAEAMRPEATVASVCETALAAAPATPLKTFDRRPFASFREYLELCLDVASRHTDVLAARPDLYSKCLCYHHIDPLELWGLALAIFRISGGDVRQAAIGGTNIGRDSDTIAGRAAMLAGTLSGAANVPPEWVAMFPPHAITRIRQNAGRLAELIAGPKSERQQRRWDIAKGAR